MAACEQTALGELSLDLSSLREQDRREASLIEARLREFSGSSSDQDDMEELVIKDATPMRSESTRLDLSGLSTSGSEDSGGPSLSRDRRRNSTLPSVSQRPFLAGDAWGNADNQTTESADGRNRLSGKRVSMETSDRSRTDHTESAKGRAAGAIDVFTTDKLPLMPKRNTSVNVSPQRTPAKEKGVGFGSTYIRDSGTFQSTRLYGRPLGQPSMLPSFLRAHSKNRRVQTVTITKDHTEAVPKSEETVEIQKPKDFATLHLLARRSQGHMRYRYMSMINDWIAEHGMPNS